MSVDWWARGLAIGGVVLGAVGIVWRWFEWWVAGHARLKVVASAGQVQQSPNRFGILSGPGVDESSIIVRAVNTSRRVVIVRAVGFLDRRGKHRFLLAPLPPHQLPATLGQGEDVSGWGNPEKLTQALRSGAQLVPFCEDSEGRIHKGEEDEHFRRFKRRAKEAADA